MNAEDVARYLTENPEFFDEHSELLSQISVSNPHGGSAIALSDRQVLTLRENNKTLEAKLAELIEADRKAFNGLALAIVRAKRGETGEIAVIATSDGLAGARATIGAE